MREGGEGAPLPRDRRERCVVSRGTFGAVTAREREMSRLPSRRQCAAGGGASQASPHFFHTRRKKGRFRVKERVEGMKEERKKKNI